MQYVDHLRRELAQYVIGPKLKLLRLRRSMGLQQLGERSGLSPSLLSRVENGKHLPTVATLLRIAQVFDVTLDHFFTNEKRERVVRLTRKEERKQVSAGDPAWSEGCFLSKLDLGSGERKFHSYLGEFDLSKSTRPHAHEGVEFVHVLLGTLGLVIGTEENILAPGDSIYFDSAMRHSYRGLSPGPCMVLMVCADPGRNLAERRMDRLRDLHVVGRQSQTRCASASPMGGGASRRFEPTTRKGVAQEKPKPTASGSVSPMSGQDVGTRVKVLYGYTNGIEQGRIITGNHSRPPSKNGRAVHKSDRGTPPRRRSSSRSNKDKTP